MSNTSSSVQTFATVGSTSTQTFTLSTGTRTQQVARYLADDLCGLIKDASIDLAYWLGIPADEQDFMLSSEDLAELICNDIEQMLRDGLISGVHFVLSELKPDPNSSSYNLKYHAHYAVDLSQRSLSSGTLDSFGGRLEVPTQAARQARFALLIDWAPGVRAEDIELVERPRYFFDWRPPTDRYDASYLVRYRTGGLDTVVVRTESTLPGNVP